MKKLLAFVLACELQLWAQAADPCPMHKEHMDAAQHQAEVEKHGNEAMGFPQDKTTHHFRLAADGGTIEVAANEDNDKQNRDAIRSHLTHIATMFANGDFSAPMFIHGEVPPGVPVMKERRAQISYSYEELAGGGAVRMRTNDREALKAIHEFLRFQIEEHRTGDRTE